MTRNVPEYMTGNAWAAGHSGYGWIMMAASSGRGQAGSGADTRERGEEPADLYGLAGGCHSPEPVERAARTGAWNPPVPPPVRLDGPPHARPPGHAFTSSRHHVVTPYVVTPSHLHAVTSSRLHASASPRLHAVTS